MRLLILPKGMLGPPIEMEATLVLVQHDDGTPIMVSGEYGPEGAIRSSHALDDDFNKTLRELGITQLSVCDRLVLPGPPPGAKILMGPKQRGG